MDNAILETERLVLSPWGEDAEAELFALHNDPEVARFLDPQGRGWSREKIAQRLAGWQRDFRSHGLGKQRLTRKSDGAFVGRAGISLLAGGKPELGYSLVRMHWGQGYATEIATGLSDWLFATREFASLIAYAHVDNVASRRVLEKIGMTPTHVAEHNGMPHQYYRKERA